LIVACSPENLKSEQYHPYLRRCDVKSSIQTIDPETLTLSNLNQTLNAKISDPEP
jgi:hypothetical protein